MSVTPVGRSVSPIGLGLGLVFWFASLTPTLVPRGWIVQGVVSGLCLAIGYGIGTLAERIVRRATRPHWSGSGHLHPLVVLVASVGVGIAGMLAWATWQDGARDLVGAAHLGWWEGPPMVVLSVGAGLLLIRIGATVAAWARAGHALVGAGCLGGWRCRSRSCSPSSSSAWWAARC